MREHKKHIALFFVVVFITSQFSFAFHDILCDHHNHNIYVKASKSETHIESKDIVLFNDVCDCFLCHQYQIDTLHLGYIFQPKIRDTHYTNIKAVSYTTPLCNAYWYVHTSLRAPPGIIG